MLGFQEKNFSCTIFDKKKWQEAEWTKILRTDSVVVSIQFKRGGRHRMKIRIVKAVKQKNDWSFGSECQNQVKILPSGLKLLFKTQCNFRIDQRDIPDTWYCLMYIIKLTQLFCDSTWKCETLLTRWKTKSCQHLSLLPFTIMSCWKLMFFIWCAKVN